MPVTIFIEILLLEPQNHRMVWIGRDFKDPFKPPCHGQRQLLKNLHQVPQSPIQIGFEHSRDGAPTASLGNMFQCVTTFIVKHLCIYSKPTYF